MNAAIYNMRGLHSAHAIRKPVLSHPSIKIAKDLTDLIICWDLHPTKSFGHLPRHPRIVTDPEATKSQGTKTLVCRK